MKMIKTITAAVLLLVLSTVSFATETKPVKKMVKKEAEVKKRHVSVNVIITYTASVPCYGSAPNCGGGCCGIFTQCFTVGYDINGGMISGMSYVNHGSASGLCSYGTTPSLVWTRMNINTPSDEQEMIKSWICARESASDPENVSTCTFQ